MGKRALWIAGGVVVLCAALASGAALLANRSLDHGPSAEMNVYQDGPNGGGKGLPVMWHAPSFAFPNQKGGRTTDRSLRGHVWIADFFFTQCTTVCPLLSAKMVLLERQIPDPGVRFVSFSVDPDHDTPEVLARYQKQWNAKEPRWLMLHTDAAGLTAVSKGMRVAVQHQGDPQNPILHTNLFFLVDTDGNVRGIYPSNDQAALGKLVEDTRTLTGGARPHAVVAANASGAQIFATLGCAACHGQPRLAPALPGIAGKPVHLTNGSTVTADDAYLRESIDKPGAKVVAGYLRLMPSYAGYLTDAQVERLVAYVRTMAPPAQPGMGDMHGMEGMTGTAPSSGSGATAALAKDPVCGMQVRATPDAPHADYQGHTYYFCSDRCRTHFEAHPSSFAAH